VEDPNNKVFLWNCIFWMDKEDPDMVIDTMRDFGKGSNVKVTGYLKKREYNGKEYIDLVVKSISHDEKSSAQNGGGRYQNRQQNNPVPANPFPPSRNEQYVPSQYDDDMPF